MICHVTVQTENLKESVNFYQWLLNLPVVRELNTPHMQIAFLGENETKLELIQTKGYKKSGTADGISVGFTVKSLEEKIEMLKSKNIEVSDIISPMPSERFCYFNDLNGIKIQLMEEK